MDNKSCENCRYFLRHFVLYGKRFIHTNCGHCSNYNIHYVTKKYKKDFTACNLWEAIEIQKAEQRKQLKYLMQNAAHSLDDILAILQSDYFD